MPVGYTRDELSTDAVGCRGMKTQLMSKFLEARRAAVIASLVVTTVVIWAAFVGVAGATTVGTPVISGNPQEGVTLSVTNAAAVPNTATISDQWLACTGATCNPIAGATGTSLPLTSAEVGKTIEVTEKADDGTTVSNPATATSAATTAVAPLPAPVNTTAPTIAGTAQLGQPLTLTPGVWTNGTTVTNQWESCVGATCTAIPGATGLTYTVAVGDVGRTIDVLESASNDGTTTPVTARSAQTGVVVAPPVNALPPVVLGTAQQGQLLTVTPGTWINVPTSITHQWEDCTGLICSAISGQTGTSYTVGPGDVGHTIQVLETAFNSAALVGVANASAQTATALATSATSVAAFSQSAPSTNQGVALVATVSSNSGNANPHGSLTFFNGSNAVPGCANKAVNGGLTVTIVCQASFGAGQPQISAAYVADPTALVAGSTSDTTSIDIGKGPTSISLAVTPKVAPRGRATYVATLGVPLSNTGSVQPSGTIDFLDGGQPIAGCANQALTSLTATCTVRYASAGQHSITARYDGDSNFTGATSPASGVQIVKGAPKKPAVRGTLGSYVAWTFNFRPRFSWPSQIKAYAVSKGTTILVRCFGKGCPFASFQITKATGTVNLVSHFGRHHLQAGDRITVRFTRKNWIGRTYTIRIRPGRKPKMTTACLAAGNAHIAVACPST